MCKSIVHMMQDLELRRSTALTRPSTAAERPAAAVQERPATSGAECATTKPLISLPIPVDRTLPIPAGMPSVDCQPNQWAPLLRDEKSRRDWVERELDACCASYDSFVMTSSISWMQRVLEGEKALRSECAKKLRDIEKKLAALKNPGWWPASASPGSQSEEHLLKKKQELNKELDLHSKQVGRGKKHKTHNVGGC